MLNVEELNKNIFLYLGDEDNDDSDDDSDDDSKDDATESD